MKLFVFFGLRWKASWSLVGLVFVACAAGCATGPDFQRSSPVQLAPLDVISWRPYDPYAHRRLCILPFQSPAGMESVGMPLASAYRQVLAREGVFSSPLIMEPQEPGMEASFGLKEMPDACGLVLTGTVEQIHVGSGALPTVLVITVRLVDAHKLVTLWEVVQTGRSFPSTDVELLWHVVSGPGAADHRQVARHMAWQLASFLKGANMDGRAGRDASNEPGG
ncbi:hypothetical protein [Desulfosoma caldarium]|uniref:Lipoprotein n=1 Tax=Desulfosoma caldarium TaxID=610254 RepID=A0A3N1VGG4_9BACT|nr:hypothetical protein [Desulfosoma caldarium]ROR01924.1 hypothetical protein EDC27_1118 [Desulfosoma caldarium]